MAERALRMEKRSGKMLPVRLSLLVIWAILAGLLTTPLVGVEPNTLSEVDRRAGWRLLFDGHSTQGWRNYGRRDVRCGWRAHASGG